jgi:hypothetical protein
LTLILKLGGHRRSTWTAEGRDLGWSWAYVDAASAAVVGDTIAGVHDHGTVVDVGDAGNVNPVDGAVVIEVVAVPVTAVIAVAGVAETIVNAAIETNMKTPVPAVEAVAVVVEAPVAGRPESAIVGWSAPRAGNPIVSGRRPAPVAGRPEIVGLGGFGLIVFR